MVVSTQKILWKTTDNRKENKTPLNFVILNNLEIMNPNTTVNNTSTTARLNSLIECIPSLGLPNTSLYWHKLRFENTIYFLLKKTFFN
jgi:hypothetical protein